MSNDDNDSNIYDVIWKVPLDNFNQTEKSKPKPPPRNGSIKTQMSESDDYLSDSYKNFEGESVDNLDIHVIKPCRDKSNYTNFFKPDVTPLPKMPCFSEFDDNDTLEFHGPIYQIVQKITTNKKTRYAVLMSDRLVLFEKPEHKVSKVQIPLKSMKGIDWYDNVNCSNKNDCNKFKLDTPVKPFKFQCSSHENAGMWINHIGKLIFNKQNTTDTLESYLLKATVSIESIKGKRIFTVEPKYTLAYYESEEDFKYGIAMHRIQLRSSGVKRDGSDVNSFTLITSYRKYKLTFETNTICNEWFQQLSMIIQKAISSTCSKNTKSGEEIMREICVNSSNKYCAECKSSTVEWASINLFITLCLKCSGLHRGLGPNVSVVQGIFTDESKWEDSNLIKLFQIIGNHNANAFWMARCEEEIVEINFKWIYDKYVGKKFIEKRELIFEKFKNPILLNEELLIAVKDRDVLRTMSLTHIGADINYVSLTSEMNASAVAQQHNQQLQITFLKNQCKRQVKDWRNDLYELYDKPVVNEAPFQERNLLCSINQDSKEHKIILISNNYIQILGNHFSRKEICKILFQNICLVREKKNESDQISLVIVVRESEFTIKSSNANNLITIIEFYGSENDQSNDISDFKNVIGQNVYPNFVPSFSFDCMGWVILSTVSEDWKPFLLVLNYNSIAEFYDPKEINQDNPLTINLRMVQKIEELKDNNYENVCPFKMYNLASICLISSVIYHIRGDTKEAYEELLKAFQQSWNVRDSTSLSNQFLTKNNVPLPVYKMVRYLQLHGTQIEGLFRRVGSVKEAEKIYNQLISDPNSFVLSNCEPHDVASALKLFFRKLNDPLLTSHLYQYWIIAVDLEDPEQQFNYYKLLIKELPIINYQTLRLLIFLLVNIIKNNEITQMNPDNLGTSFNTCLLTGSKNEGFLPKNLQVLPYLIKNYQDLFDVTKEELDIENIMNKERKKINDIMPTEISLLRQIYIHPELESYLKQDITFEKEHDNKKSSNYKELFSKHMRIEQSMTSMVLLQKIFNNTINTNDICLFEDRKIDELHMHRLIYPQENLIEVIQHLEMSELKQISPKRWIFKMNDNKIESKKKIISFKCWASLSMSNKNKVYIEVIETRQLNIWKNDQFSELLINIPIKSLMLFRSCEKDKCLVAFEDRKSHSSLPSLLQLLSFKSRSSFNFINFFSKTDYFMFLQCYDQSKLIEPPTEKRIDTAKRLL